MNITLAFLVFLVAFAILLKSADWFVDGAVGIAYLLHLPKMLVGIVLMGLATTSPELAVSVISAYQGHPSIALGNAVGSVIADDGLALALAAIIASRISIDRRLLKRVGLFLIGVFSLSFLLAYDAEVTRIEGLILVVLLILYFVYLVWSERRRRNESPPLIGLEPDVAELGIGKIVLLFSGGAVGVIISSHLIVTSGLFIAKTFRVPEIVIGLTLIALGTSLPEVSTAIVAARKGHAEVTVGNILGADILNILLIIGASAVVHPIQVDPKDIRFAYPWAFLVVTVMLLSMWHRHTLTRKKGVLLLVLYGIYLVQVVHSYF